MEIQKTIRTRKKPLVVVTNDDGISALGLNILVEKLESIAQVIVAAPDQERSAIGHGISLSRPLRIAKVAPGRFAISGTPADAVLLALFHLCPRRPDLVLSGINMGLNLGTDVFYSGTLAGALEGLIHGVPSIAVSQEIPESRTKKSPVRQQALLERTASFAARLAKQVLAQPKPSIVALNINAPANLTKKFRWTRLGKRAYREQVEQRLDLRGAPYYWIGGPPVLGESEPGTDGHTVEEGLLSITPLDLDLTAEAPAQYYRWKMDEG